MNTPDFRQFIGWNRPAIELVAEKLEELQKKAPDTFRRATVVVPTSESGRRLREYMEKNPKEKKAASNLRTTMNVQKSSDSFVSVNYIEKHNVDCSNSPRYVSDYWFTHINTHRG